MQEIKRNIKHRDSAYGKISLEYLTEEQYKEWNNAVISYKGTTHQLTEYIKKSNMVYEELLDDKQYLEFEATINKYSFRAFELEKVALDTYTKALQDNKQTIIDHANYLLISTSSEAILDNLFNDLFRHNRLLRQNNEPIKEMGLLDAIGVTLNMLLYEQLYVCSQYNYTDVVDTLNELALDKANTIIEELPQERVALHEKQVRDCTTLTENTTPAASDNITYDLQNRPLLNRLMPITKPHTFYENNTILSNDLVGMFDMLIKEGANGQLTLLPTKLKYNALGENKKAEVYNTISFSYGGELSFNKARIKEYDLLVLDAVCTILYAGNGVLTDADIYRTLKGNTKTRPTAKQLERIHNAMLKMSGTRMYVDITEELNKGMIDTENEEILKGVWDKAIVEYDGLELTSQNGTTVKAYSFKEKAGGIKYPMIMQYCQAKGQIISYPIQLLDTPEHYTEDYAVMKSYLLKEITNLKKGHRYNNNTFLYSTMYSKCRLEEPTHKELKRKDREVIKKMLDYWVSEKYIKAYKDHKEGRAITGIEVTI